MESIYEVSGKPEFTWNRTRWKTRLLIALGELSLLENRPDAAQAYLNETRGLGLIDQMPYGKYQVRAGRLQGNINAAGGKWKEAETELRQALNRAEALAHPSQLWRTRHALGNLYAQMDRAEDALTQFQAARDLVRSIADGLTDAELKEGFLAAETIRDVCAQARSV